MRLLRLLFLGIALSCASAVAFAPSVAHATARHEMSRSELIREIRHVLETRIHHLSQEIHAAWRVKHDPHASPEARYEAWKTIKRNIVRISMIKHQLACLPHLTKRELLNIYHEYVDNMSNHQT